MNQQQLNFQNLFFSKTMNQTFNSQVQDFASDEYEPAIIKWLRASNNDR